MAAHNESCRVRHCSHLGYVRDKGINRATGRNLPPPCGIAVHKKADWMEVSRQIERVNKFIYLFLDYDTVTP